MKYYTLTVLTLLFWTTSSYAWRCGQDCPSNWLAGRAECEANNVACQIDLNPIPPLPVPTGSPAPTGRDNYYFSLVCIENNLNFPVTYSYHWGNEPPRTQMVYPNNGQTHAWQFKYVNENRAPTFFVEFDWITAPGYQRKGYTLRSWSVSEKNCNTPGTKEIFQSRDGGQTIEMINIQK